MVLKINIGNNALIRVDGEAPEEVENFTCFCSIVDKLGGTDADVHVRVGKARAKFHQLKKMRIFNTVIKPKLLHGADTLRTIAKLMRKLQTFLNTFLRRILNNHELWERIEQ